MKVFPSNIIAAALDCSRKSVFRRAARERWARHMVRGKAHFVLPVELALQCRKLGPAVQLIDPKQFDRQLTRAMMVFAFRSARKTFPHLSADQCAERVVEEFSFPGVSVRSLHRWHARVLQHGLLGLVDPRKRGAAR